MNLIRPPFDPANRVEELQQELKVLIFELLADAHEAGYSTAEVLDALDGAVKHHAAEYVENTRR